MAGYLIANLEINDAATFGHYREQVVPLIAQFGGRYIVRGGELQPLEGQLPFKRLIVIEFPSVAEARRFYDSPEYEPVMQLRLDSCKSDIVLVDGYSG